MAVKTVALMDLVADLNPVAARWHDLGVQLGIDDGELKNISGEEGRAQSCFREMLIVWMRNQTPTCRAIINALHSPAVQHNALASELERTKEFNDSNLTLRLLLNKLKPLTAGWHSFGIQLGVDPNKLSELECHVRNVKRYLTDMLVHWLNDHEPAPTVKDLLDALRSPAMMERRLAAKLEEKYKGCRLAGV